jgi:hypothetical protein
MRWQTIARLWEAVKSPEHTPSSQRPTLKWASEKFYISHFFHRLSYSISAQPFQVLTQLPLLVQDLRSCNGPASSSNLMVESSTTWRWPTMALRPWWQSWAFTMLSQSYDLKLFVLLLIIFQRPRSWILVWSGGGNRPRNWERMATSPIHGTLRWCPYVWRPRAWARTPSISNPS